MIAFFLLLAAAAPLPIRVFHGLFGRCTDLAPELRGACVETSPALRSAVQSLDSQAQIGCAILRAERAQLANGFYMVGLSQGGLVARKILHHCFPVNTYVLGMVFVGAPHMGVKRVPILDSVLPGPTKSIVNSGLGVVSRFTGSSGVNAGVIQYFNGAGKTAFMRELEDTGYDSMYARLPFIVNVMSRREKTVIPSESTTFGAKSNRLKTEIEPAENLPYYQEHIDGVGGLYLRGRMINCLSDADHANLIESESQVIFDFLLDEGNTRLGEVDPVLLLNQFMLRYPNFCRGFGKVTQRRLSP